MLCKYALMACAIAVYAGKCLGGCAHWYTLCWMSIGETERTTALGSVDGALF